MADFTALKTAIQNAIKQNGNEEITGNLLQEVLLAIVTTLGDGSINDLITALGSEATTRSQADGTLQQDINTEAQARQLADSTLQGGINTAMQAINAINNAITNGCVYAGIATPSSTPASGKVFYLALTAGTYTNYGGLEVSQGINILKNNGSAWSLDSFVGIDDAPAPSSQKLVKSGGVFDEVIKNGSAFDLSAYNGGATYADLNAALTALNALPAAYKRGGMSVKFVQSSDNKYVQFRLMSDSFNTTPSNWQGVDNEPTAGSDNLVKSSGVYIPIYMPLKSQVYIDKSVNRGDTTRTPSNDNGVMCAVVDVEEYQKYYICGKGLGGPRLYFVTNQNNEIIQETSSNYTTQGETFFIPEGGVKLYYNCKYSEFSNPCLRYIGQYIANDYTNDTDKAAASIHLVKQLKDRTDDINFIVGQTIEDTVQSNSSGSTLTTIVCNETHIEGLTIHIESSAINGIRYKTADSGSWVYKALEDNETTIDINDEIGYLSIGYISDQYVSSGNITYSVIIKDIREKVKDVVNEIGVIENILTDNSKTIVPSTFYGDSVIVGYNSTNHTFNISTPTDTNYKSYYISDISLYAGKVLKCKFDARPNVGSGKNAILIAATNGTKAEIFRDTNAGAGIDYTDGLLSVDVDKWLAYLATKSISSNEAYFTLEASKGDDYKIYYTTSSLHQGSIPDEIGNLSDLQTTEKKTIVGAINEIAENGITEEEKQQIIDDAVSEAATTIQRDPISAEQEEQIVQDVIAQVPIQFTQQQVEYLGQILTTGIFKSIGSSQLSYMQALGKYIMSYRFKQQVSTPFFNVKLSEEDALVNSAGRTLIHSGYLYCLKMQNHLEHPTIENEYAELVKINLSDPTDYIVLRVFDYDTDYTFSDSSTMHVDYCGEGNFLIINNVMYLTFACVVTINNVSSTQVICRSVDVSTMTITSTNKCTFKSLEGVTGNFNSQFMYDCGYTQSNTDGSGAFLSTGFTEYDGYYYSNCRFRPTSSQLYGMIVRTADMINFEAIFKTPDPTQGETAININSNGIAHIASRSPTWKTDNRMIIRKYNVIDSTTEDVGINNWTLLDSAIIESCLSMPTFFRHNTNLYLWSGGHVHQGNAQGFIDQNPGRRFYKCTLVNEASLIDCVTQFDTDYVQIGPNTILTSDGTYIYGCVTGVNLVVVRFEMPSVTVGECDAILAGLLT